MNNPNEIDDMEYTAWLDAQQLTDADINELARRYDTGEFHCIPPPRTNPHGD